MKSFLRRLFKILAYTAGGLVILLAIVVGLFRLFRRPLSRVPDAQRRDDNGDLCDASPGPCLHQYP